MKKITLFGGMFLVLCMLSSCGNTPSPDKPLVQEPHPAVALVSPAMARAFETLNDAYCDNISTETEKKDCQNQVTLAKAIRENTKEACNALPNGSMRDACSKNMYVSRSIASKSDESCNALKGSLIQTCRNEVNINLAFQSLNTSQCDAISDNENKEACKNQIVILLAKQKGDTNLCNTLQGSLQDNCRDNIYYDEAMDKNDKSFCDKIKTDFLKTNCLQKG